MRSTRPLALASSANCGLASKAALHLCRDRDAGPPPPAPPPRRYQDLHHRGELFAVRRRSWIFPCTCRRRFYIRRAWPSAARPGSCRTVPCRKISPTAGARNREIAFGLHPDLVGRRGGEIVAQPGREKAGGLGDDEFAFGAEAVQRGGNFLGLGQGQRAIAQPHHHALDAGIARRHRPARRPDPSPSAAAPLSERPEAGGIRDRTGADPASAPCWPAGRRPAPVRSPAARQRSGSAETTNLAMPFRTAAMIERSQCRKPIMGNPSAQSIPYIAARPSKTARQPDKRKARPPAAKPGLSVMLKT